MTAAPTAIGNASSLSEKLRDRHAATVQSFQKTVRETCQQLDVDALNALTDLRTTLAISRTRSEGLMETLELRINSGRTQLEREAEAFSQRQVGEAVALVVDYFHVDGVHSPDSREERIVAERAAVLQMYVQLRVLHGERMEHLQLTNNVLVEIETNRRQTLRQLMETLMHDLSKIAHLGVTDCHVLVQRAIASVNEQLITNQRTCKTLISQLKQHELLKQRDYAERSATLFGSLLHLAQDSAILWTQQLLASKSFRDPRSRTSMLKRIQAASTATKGEVTHALHGMQSLAETLKRYRSSDMLETCGGTEPNGWLRFFNDDIFKPIFSQPPGVVADEWRVFLEVILHNAQCSVVTLSEDTDTIESQLIAEMGRMCDVLAQTIEFIYTPKDEEVEWVRQGSLDGENLYPFQNFVNPDVGSMEDGKRAAHEALQPLCTELHEESSWFKKTVAQNLELHKSQLDDALMRAPGNVTATFKDTTAAMTTATETPQQHVRTFYVTQYEAEKDYVDQLSWLERDVADITNRLEHAGTIDTAKSLCIEGMAKLEEIERLYVRYHKQRVGPMPTATADAEKLLESESKALYVKLNVVPRVAGGAAVDASPSLETSLKGSKRVASKLSSSLLQQPPSALSVTVLEPGQQVITLSDGSELVVLGPMKYGMDVPPVPKAEELTSPTTASVTTPRAPGDKPAGKAPAPKGKKPTAADAEAEAAELAAAQAAAALHAQPSPTLAWFIARLEPILSDVFCDGCLFSESSIIAFKNTMRDNMLEWLLQLKIRVMNSIRMYCDENKKALDRQMNECIRRHQRRPPTLQAQIYETRLRELHDGNISREKYFEWLTGRVATLTSNAALHQQKCTDEFQRDLDRLRETTANVSNMMSAAALESHGRSVADGARRALVKIQQREEEGKKQVQQMIATILQECTSFRNERLKSFEEGGSMAKEETQAAADSIARTIADGEAASANAIRELETLSAAQSTSLEAVKASYHDTKVHNSDELAFFVRIQEVFAQLKGRVSNLMSTSVNTQRSIDEMLQELEDMLASAPLRTDASALEKRYLSTDYPASFKELRRSITDIDTSAPESWQGYHETLSNRLISTNLTASAGVRQALPNKLLMLIDKLRMALYLRGLFLGCLAYNVEYLAVPPDSMIEPPRGAAANNNAGVAGTTSVDPGAGKKGAAASPKGAKGAASGGKGDAAAAASSAISATPAAVPAVIKAETEVSKWAATCQSDFTTTAQKYFQSRAPPLLRPQVLGGVMMDEVQLTAAARISEQQEKSSNHIAEATKRYREQVQRLFFALHNCGAVLCNGLFNLSVSSLTMRLDDVFRVFNKFYSEMLHAKADNSSLVKGSLALPSNRPQLEALNATESARQEECKRLLQAFEQICLRELQEEASRVSSRVCHSTQTLFTMLRGVVTPEHIVPGEGVVLGQHKSLKKLMRQKLREDAAKALETSAGVPAGGGKGGAAPAAAAKKPEAKKPAEKPSGKGGKGGKGDSAVTGTKQEDEDAAAGLVPLERTLTEYPGIITNAVRVFLRYRADHPSLESPPNHYVRPAQWEAERLFAKQQQELEQQAAAEQSKKPAAKAAAKPAAKASSPTAAGPNGIPGTPSTPLVDDDVSVALTAPRDRLHQQTVLLRQTSVEAFTALCSKMGAESQRKFESLLTLEGGWNASWVETINSLCTEKNQPPKK